MTVRVGRNLRYFSTTAFSLVEMLIVISVIGIMAGLAISAFSNASQDTRRVTARQQQIAVQNAVNAWVNRESTGQGKSIMAARSAYNAKGSSKDRLELVSDYLDEVTFLHFKDNTSTDSQVSSGALKKTNQYLSLSKWEAASYPKVELIKN